MPPNSPTVWLVCDLSIPVQIHTGSNIAGSVLPREYTSHTFKRSLKLRSSWLTCRDTVKCGKNPCDKGEHRALGEATKGMFSNLAGRPDEPPSVSDTCAESHGTSSNGLQVQGHFTHLLQNYQEFYFLLTLSLKKTILTHSLLRFIEDKPLTEILTHCR